MCPHIWMHFQMCLFYILCIHTGIGRDLVVAVEDITKESPKIGEDTLSKREVEDLNRGRAFVRSILESGGSVLASSISEGVKACAKVILCW